MEDELAEGHRTGREEEFYRLKRWKNRIHLDLIGLPWLMYLALHQERHLERH